MNKFFSDLQKEARRQKLSNQEKQAMRAHIYALTNPTLTPSPFQWFSISTFPLKRSVLAATVLVVALSGGTAFAAQSALPGSPLYAVKINVNEQVEVALATTPEAKAKVNASLAQTRLDEAETLAANGTLDATTSAELASNFTVHAAAAVANTAALKQADPGTAAELSATFSSTLSAQSAILTQLGSDAASSSVQKSSDSLAVQALTLAEQGQTTNQPITESDAQAGEGSTTLAMIAPLAAPATPLYIDATAATSSTPNAAPQAVSVSIQGDNAATDAVVAALQTQASTTLAEAEADFASLEPSLGASTSLQVQTELTAAQDLFAQGTASLGASDTLVAKSAFTRVLRASVRLDAFLKAGQKFDHNFLSSLLK